MKSKSIVVTHNLSRFKRVFGDLVDRASWVTGMGLVVGEPGLGKTTAITWLSGQTNCIFLTADPVWGTHSLLDALLSDLGVEMRSASASRKYDKAVQRLRETKRPIVVDECDFLTDSRLRKQLLEILRTLHDKTDVPVILVGMQDLKAKLHHYPQILGRISREIQFERLNQADVLLTLNSISEVPCTPELAAEVLATTRGYIRQVITIGMDIDRRARAQGWKEVTPELWGGVQSGKGGALREVA